MKSVKGKRVLVTGAAMGMGRMFAEQAVAEGASEVILWDIAEDALAETTQALEALDHSTITPRTVDVRSLDQIREAAAEAGTVDVLINNAGVVRGNKYFWESDTERDTDFTIEINTLAPMRIAREFLPGMVASTSQCRVMNLASAAGFTANPRMAVYAGSKWAMLGWSDSVRLELEQANHRHVRVTTVCPYYVRTGMFEGAKSALLLPLLEPADVVSQSWAAMLDGRPLLVLPKTVLLGEALKGILPLNVRDYLVGKVFGVHHTMDEFKGRAGQQV